ncbi:hypothetical protein BJ912DRAFT_316134 [Pholiota molesta]|nr:hypothetical protein BJ912DRAFT_316134 [Pholiota molesta]
MDTIVFFGHQQQQCCRFYTKVVSGFSKRVEAEDMIRRLRPYEDLTDCVLRVFKPKGRNLSFLHFCIIVEDVHVQEPNYHLFCSQCYWFAMMVIGISMLQGGHIQVYDIPQKNGTAEPRRGTLKTHTTTNRQMPTGLGHKLSIPSLSEEDIKHVPDEDIKHITNMGSAGTIKYGAFKVRVISVPFSTIWEAGRESRNQYRLLCNELARVQNCAMVERKQLEDQTLQAKSELLQAQKELLQAKGEAQQANERADRAEAEAQRAKAELERFQKSVSRRRLDSVASVISILPSTSEL